MKGYMQVNVLRADCFSVYCCVCCVKEKCLWFVPTDCKEEETIDNLSLLSVTHLNWMLKGKIGEIVFQPEIESSCQTSF